MSYLLKPLNGGPTIPLTREIIVVGRSPRCDVVLNQTEFVSRRHCRIITTADRVILNDLGSTNGVYVNRNRVGTFFVLQCGDHVRIGGLKFELLAESTARVAVGAAAGEGGSAGGDWSIPLGIPEPPFEEPSAAPNPMRSPHESRDDSGAVRRGTHSGESGSPRSLEKRTALESNSGPAAKSGSDRRNRGDSRGSKTPETRKRKPGYPRELEVGDGLKPLSSDSVRVSKPKAKPSHRSSGSGGGSAAVQPFSQGTLPPPSSMFIKTDWASFEDAGTAIQNVTLQCPTCDNEFEWTVERPDDAPPRLTPGLCPRCGRDIAPLTDEEVEQLLELEQLPSDDDEEIGMTYGAANAMGAFGTRRHGGVKWLRVSKSLDFTFLSLLALGFVVTAFFSLMAMGVFGNLLAQVGSVFIPFQQDRPSPEGAELVWKGVAALSVGCLPLLLLLTIYNITDESFLFALLAVVAGVVFSLVIWTGGVVSMVPFYFLTLVALAGTVGAFGAGTCLAWRIPGPEDLQKFAIGASCCLFLGVAGLVFALFCANGSQDHVLGRVPVMPPPWLFCATYVFLAGGWGAWCCLLEGLALYFRDPQLYESVKQHLMFAVVVALYTICVLAFSIGMDPESPAFAGVTLTAGLGNAIGILWFADLVGSSRYLIR